LPCLRTWQLQADTVGPSEPVNAPRKCGRDRPTSITDFSPTTYPEFNRGQTMDFGIPGRPMARTGAVSSRGTSPNILHINMLRDEKLGSDNAFRGKRVVRHRDSRTGRLVVPSVQPRPHPEECHSRVARLALVVAQVVSDRRGVAHDSEQHLQAHAAK